MLPALKNSILLVLPSVPGLMVMCRFSPALSITGATMIWVVSLTAAPVMPLRLNATAPVRTRNIAIKATCWLVKSMSLLKVGLFINVAFRSS